MKRASAFADRLPERPLLAAAPAVVLALLALPLVFGLEIDNRLEIWLDRDGDAYREYEDFRRTFGSEEFILAVYPCPETVDLAFLERLTDLRFELEEVAGVRRVVDLAEVYSRLFSLRGIEAFREELAQSPFLRGFLISPDQRLAATWIHLELSATAVRGPVVAAVEAAVRTFPREGPPHPDEIRLAGSPFLNDAMDRSSRKAARTFFPLVFLVSAAMLLLLFRRLSGVLIPFAAVGTGILWTLAIVALAGRSLNMVTVTLPPLVWVLGLSTAIHLLSRWNQALAQGLDASEATRRTLRELFRPCLYSALTTALGFASLTASSMEPVREMGGFTALGIAFCFAANFLLFPLLTALYVRFSRRRPRFREDHPVLDFLVRWSRRPRWLLAAAAAGSLLLAAAIPRLRVESNPIEFFHDDAPIAVTYLEVLPDFTGPYSLEITLEPPALADGSYDLGVLARLDELRTFLESRDGVARAVSVVDLLKKAQQGHGGIYRLPEDEAERRDAWRRLEKHADELEAFVAGGAVRVTVLAQPLGSGAHRRLVEDLEAHLEGQVDAAWRPRLTGLVPLLVDTQDRLVESQVRTLGLTFLLVVLVLGALFGKASYALLSLAPNVLPVVFALGTMGWLGIPLDPATVMIAGIALGIAVDDTIHFLMGYRRRRRAGCTAAQAVEETLHGVGRPMVITSAVAAVGFLVLCVSDFVPLLHFGLLTAVTMAAALVGDLVVLPALLLVTARQP